MKKILFVILIIVSVLIKTDYAYADGNGNTIVYVTPTGSCYHTSDCWHFRTAKIETSLEEAYIKGYQICDDCNPPRYTGTATRKTELVKNSSNTDSNESSKDNKAASNIPTYKHDSQKANSKFDTSLLFIIIPAAFGVIYIAYIGISNVVDRKRKMEEQKAAEEQRRLKKEQDKAEFIHFMNGRKIREIAQVPANIKFVNGLPVDNNNSSYGSFTVYLSKNGKCFHQRQGCCSARYSAHFVKIRNKYSPCSKCCTKDYNVPSWYTTYMDLKGRARYFEIEVED